MSEKTNVTQTEGIKILLLLYKWRKVIIIFCSLAIVAVSIFSGPSFISPQYKSELVLYPPGTNSNKVLLEKYSGFGSDKEIDEQIQILKSNIVRDSIIKKYDLISRYNIDPLKHYKLNKEFEDNVQIDRTRYNSISVTVFDTDPDTAAMIANDIVRIGDEVKADILRRSLNEALNCFVLDFNKKLSEFDRLEQSNSNRKNGILIENTIPNHQMIIDNMKQQIESRKRINPKDHILPYDSEIILNQLGGIQIQYEDAASNLNNNFPTVYIISPAEVSDRKAYPQRALMVVITAISSLLIISFWIIIVEKFKRIRAAFNI